VGSTAEDLGLCEVTLTSDFEQAVTLAKPCAASIALAVYTRDEVRVPELLLSAAFEPAQALVRPRAAQPELRFGVSGFPGTTSVQELQEAARSSCRSATWDCPS
jgi:hypothetical protein